MKKQTIFLKIFLREIFEKNDFEFCLDFIETFLNSLTYIFN